MSKLQAFWASLPYSVTGGVVRAIRGAVGFFMGTLVVGVTTGTLFQDVNDKTLVIILGALVLGADKWLREHNLEAAAPRTSVQVGPTKRID